jgi:hypothetical protein
MTNFNQTPRTAGLERLDGREPAADWTQVRDLVQTDLAAIDAAVRAGLPMANVRFGSNRDGAGRLFVYRVYEPRASPQIDPVVVGIVVAPTGPADTFRVSGDIAGELLGDVLFEVPPREITGREALTEAARDAVGTLAQRSGIVLTALRDVSRHE